MYRFIVASVLVMLLSGCGLKLPDQINLPTQLTGGDPQTLEAATAAAQEILLVRIRCAAETLSPATSHTGVRVSLSE